MSDPPSMDPAHPHYDPKLSMLKPNSIEEEMVDIIFELAQPVLTNICCARLQNRAIILVTAMEKRGRIGKGPPRKQTDADK